MVSGILEAEKRKAMVLRLVRDNTTIPVHTNELAFGEAIALIISHNGQYFHLSNSAGRLKHWSWTMLPRNSSSSSVSAAEREVLGNLLFALFLESPKRKPTLTAQRSLLLHQDTPPDPRPQQKRYLGGTHNG